MKSDDYVKFLTEQFVHFMETPRSERKTVRIEKKQSRPPRRNLWFGLVPDAIEHYAGQAKTFLAKCLSLIKNMNRREN